jgi:acyl carrier protein
MSLRARLTGFIAEQLLRNPSAMVDPEENLFDRGIIDSIGLVSLISVVEAESGVRVPDEQVTPENFESVAAMERLAERLRTTR